MNQITLYQGESWMTPEERDLNREFIHATTENLVSRGIPETPLVMLRVNDVIVTWLLARRLEATLTPEPGEPAPCPTPTQAGAIGKCRDRLRRAMKDLEACCPRNTTPLENSLVDRMNQAPQHHSEPAPAREIPNEAQPPENADPEASDNPNPEKIIPTVQTATTQPETQTPSPTPTPTQPPATQPTQQGHTPKKRRKKKRGIPIPRQGPGRRNNAR